MIFLIFTILFFINNNLFTAEWSKNNIFKFSIQEMSDLDFLSDYEDIIITNGVIKPTSFSSWLFSKPIEVQEGLFVDRAFINIRKTCVREISKCEGKVRVRILDYNTDEIIGEKIIFNSGIINLEDFFRKTLYFSIEFIDTNVELLSFGLKGKILNLLDPKEVIIEPILIFYKEGKLLIKFKLGKPSFVDVLIFSKNTLIDTVIKENFLKKGEVVIKYDMSRNDEKLLSTGNQWIYIKAKSLDEKTEEVTKSFYFVKD